MKSGCVPLHPSGLPLNFFLDLLDQLSRNLAWKPMEVRDGAKHLLSIEPLDFLELKNISLLQASVQLPPPRAKVLLAMGQRPGIPMGVFQLASVPADGAENVL